MYNHAPADYRCPICPAVKGIENENTLIKQDDIVYQDGKVTALINSFFVGNNPGHVIVVPNEHYENIYDLPEELGGHIFGIAKQIALAIRETYGCEGVTTAQNNEPAGGQHAFHYHFHIFPRYTDDALHSHMGGKRLASPEERREYAQKLKSSAILKVSEGR